MRTFVTFSLAAGAFVVALTLSTGTPSAQQHSYTAQEIEEGRKLYDANCGRCHAESGAGVAGIELFRQIRRANSDDDIAKLIQSGIPGTAMPPSNFTTPQALSVVAYLRSMVGVTPGAAPVAAGGDRKSTRLNSSHSQISYAVFCLKKKKKNNTKHD